MKRTTLLWAALCLLPALTQAAPICKASIPASNPDSIYTDHNDGTVTDTRTGLMWKQCLEGYGTAACAADGSTTTFTWAQALNAAITNNSANSGAGFANHNDWRLPNLKELHSLVEESCYSASINGRFFPNTPSSDVWSGSPYAGGSNYAWFVNFYYGNAYSNAYSGSRSNYLQVRLVRAGQSLAPLPVLSAVALSGTPAETSADFLGTSNPGGTGYWIVVSAGSAAPTSAQVQAATNYGGATLAAHGTAAMAAHTAQTFSASGLTANTAYDFYLVVEAGGRLSAPPQKVSFSTATAVTLPEGPQNGQSLNVGLTPGNGWYIDSATTHTLNSVGTALPAGWAGLHGLVNLHLGGGTDGTAATVVLTYPQPLPPGTQYYKYGPTAGNPVKHWYPFAAAAISGNTITLTLTDGADGDDDMAANGDITDPGGPVIPMGGPGGVAGIPTLSEWALVLLSALMALAALGWMRRRA